MQTAVDMAAAIIEAPRSVTALAEATRIETVMTVTTTEEELIAEAREGRLLVTAVHARHHLEDSYQSSTADPYLCIL